MHILYTAAPLREGDMDPLGLQHLQVFHVKIGKQGKGLSLVQHQQIIKKQNIVKYKKRDLNWQLSNSCLNTFFTSENPF